MSDPIVALSMLGIFLFIILLGFPVAFTLGGTGGGVAYNREDYAEICRRGYSVSTLKHTHHMVDLDRPGKDSYRHRQAGAHQTVLASASRWAVMKELRGQPEPALEELIAKLDPVDLVIVEHAVDRQLPQYLAYITI